jgi:predicted phosphodiesterase
MASIWLLGDVHSGFVHIHRALDAAIDKPAALVFLGDIEPTRPFHELVSPIRAQGIDVRWIIGNHDTDSEQSYRNLSDPESMAMNIDGRIVTIAGIKIAGLGGVFRGHIWLPPDEPVFNRYDDFRKDFAHRQGLKRRLEKMDPISQLADEAKNGRLRKHHSSVFPEVYERLYGDRADVLCTHEAPHPHPHGFQALHDLAQAMGCKASFHGHQHDNLAYPIQGNCQPYGVGLRGISALDTDTGEVTCVVPGELDHARDARGIQYGFRKAIIR